MGTTSRGIIYPDASGVPSRSALQALATSTDTAIGQVAALVGGMKIQAGYTNVSVSGLTGTKTLTYPVAFAGTAIPIAVAANRADYYATVGSANATSCQLTVTHYQGSSATTTVAVHWIAIGPPA